MNDIIVNDSFIEDKKQEILDFFERNYSMIWIKGAEDKYQIRYIISKKYKNDFGGNYVKRPKYAKKSEPKWEDNPKVWIKIHSIKDKRGYGLAIQIKCDCLKWKSRNKKSKNQFTEKWGFPKDNTNIDYKLTHGNLLTLWVVNEALLTFNPFQDYFSYFLKEAYIVYELNSLENGMENLNDITPLIADPYEDVHVQVEMEDYLYQKEVQESAGWIKTGEIADVPVEKPLKRDKATSETYKRTRQKGINAIVDAYFLCEVDNNHKDFTSKVTGMNYVEAHHLIPMEYQDNFNFSIDVEANIVSLCVSCHKKLHHSILKEKLQILKLLYSKREKRIEKCEISVNEDVLISFYK